MSSSSAPPAPDLAERLRSEAAFQNERVRQDELDRPEARERFYFLVDAAFERYHAALANLADKEVVVVGCSADAMPAWLLEQSYVTGIDIADEAIARLERYIEEHGLQDRARALVMNAEELDLPDASVDAIVCSGVLHHLDVESSCRTWSRALRDDGEVVMLEPMAWNPAVALYRLFTPSMRTPDEHPLVPRDVRLLRRHFEQVEIESYALTTVLALILPDVAGLRRRTQRLLAPLDRFLFRVLPCLRYAAWTSYIRCSRPRRPS